MHAALTCQIIYTMPITKKNIGISEFEIHYKNVENSQQILKATLKLCDLKINIKFLQLLETIIIIQQ